MLQWSTFFNDNIEAVCLGLNAVAVSLLYRYYSRKQRNYDAVNTSRHFDIEENLGKKVTNEFPDGVVVHAVVRGHCKAIGPPIRSRHVPGATSVIQECILKEHKVQWSAFSRFWTHTEREIQKTVSVVPFALTSPLSWTKVSIEIQDPLACDDLPLRSTFDQFVPNKEGLGSAVLGWLRGEHSKGIQEQEFLLEEGTLLTGVGTLILEKGSFRLTPPNDGTDFYLTTLTHSALVNKLRTDLKIIKGGCIFFGSVLFCLSVYLVYNLWQKRLRMLQIRKDAERRENTKRERRKKLRDPSHSSSAQCVICLSNPVETIILECGHVCLCTDCAESVRNTCPICRAPVTRLVAAFLP